MLRLTCKSKDCPKIAIESRAFPGRRLFCEGHQRQLEAVADVLLEEARAHGLGARKRKPKVFLAEDDDDFADG